MLISGVMGQDCMRYLPMCLKSLENSDKIIYIDGGSDDGSVEYAKEQGCDVIINKYNQDDKSMNGKQRNVFLDYLKKKYLGEWCIFVDADEVVEDLSKIKEFINTIQPEAEDHLCSVKMRHLIGDLSHEDATQPVHFVPHRLFKIRDNLSYPEVEHPVLSAGKDTRAVNIQVTTIWHMAYCPNMWEIKKRYDNHMKKSNMHTPEFLKSWRNAHLFGTYPRTQFNPVELPSIILEEFGVDKDSLYFENRGLEVKHFIECSKWKEFFGINKSQVVFFGCGIGPRVCAMKTLGVRAVGYEISDWAVKHQLCNNIYKGDITNMQTNPQARLTVAYDLLEHIKYKDIGKAINNIINTSVKGGKILISVPVIGDPNLEADPTHIIKEDRNWWVKQFTDKGLKEVEVPEHFLFKEQLLIFEK